MKTGRRVDGKTGRQARVVIGRAALMTLALFLPVYPSTRLAAQDIGLPLGATPGTATVQDLEGRPVDFNRQFVGRKPVLIEFWATWCDICEVLLPKMEAAQRRYGAQVEFVVLGVGVNQSLNTMRRHVDRHPMPFRFYFDNAGAAVRAFLAPSTSYIVVLDARGRVVYTGVGEDQDIDAAVRRAIGG